MNGGIGKAIRRSPVRHQDGTVRLPPDPWQVFGGSIEALEPGHALHNAILVKVPADAL